MIKMQVDKPTQWGEPTINEICNRVLLRSVYCIQISTSNIELLVNKGRTSLIKGMKSKAGKKFDAYIKLDKEGNTSFEFESNKRAKS